MVGVGGTRKEKKRDTAAIAGKKAENLIIIV